MTAQNGRLDLAGASSFSGPVTADNATLYLWNSKALGATSAGLVLTNGAWLTTYASVTNDSLLTGGTTPCGLTSVGSNFWTGPIQVAASTLLTGTNTYTSATLVKGGTLLVHGAQPASDVYVYAGATLGGDGTVGPLHSTGGTISPGSGPGKLTVSGNAILDGSSKLLLEISGTTPGVSYDQLNNIGQLAANGATLQILMGFPGAINNQYVIVNHPSGLTSTLFNNLPEGGTLTASNGVTFRINYAAGDGNDTVLTQLTSVAAPQLLGLTRLGNGAVQLNGTGGPNLSYTVQASTNLGAANWVNLGTATANGLGALLYTDSQSTNYPYRFYRLVWP